MTKNALNICISEEYAETLGDLNNMGYLVKSGAAVIRNKFIFNSILTRLNKKYVSYKVIKLNVIINYYKLLSIHLLPFFIFKNSNSFQACSLSSLAKLSKAYKLSGVSDCNFVFMHHGFSLLKYYHTINNIKAQGRPIVVLEMPENIVETTSYLAHKKNCIKNLEKNLQTYARAIDIITSPTFRDSIYYSRVLNIRNVFTIYNVYNVFPDIFTDKYILNKKTHGSLCISMGAWCNESVTKFVTNILSLFNTTNKINITDIHILGCRKISKLKIGNVNIYYHGTLPLKDYLDVLSTCSVTILYPRLPWSGGHSVRLNDAALMGNVILGSDHDLRGEPYKYQYTYIDERDLVTKLQWFIDSTDLISLGMENRRIALERAEKNEKTLDRLVDILLMSISSAD